MLERKSHFNVCLVSTFLAYKVSQPWNFRTIWQHYRHAKYTVVIWNSRQKLISQQRRHYWHEDDCLGIEFSANNWNCLTQTTLPACEKHHRHLIFPPSFQQRRPSWHEDDCVRVHEHLFPVRLPEGLSRELCLLLGAPLLHLQTFYHSQHVHIILYLLLSIYYF